MTDAQYHQRIRESVLQKSVQLGSTYPRLPTAARREGDSHVSNLRLLDNEGLGRCARLEKPQARGKKMRKLWSPPCVRKKGIYTRRALNFRSTLDKKIREH